MVWWVLGSVDHIGMGCSGNSKKKCERTEQQALTLGFDSSILMQESRSAPTTEGSSLDNEAAACMLIAPLLI